MTGATTPAAPTTTAGGPAAVPTLARGRPQPLAAAQLGIWESLRHAPEAPLHECGVALTLTGALDPLALLRAVTRALDESETLRTRFHPTPDGPRRTPGPVPAPALTVTDLRRAPDPGAAADARMRAALATATDLARQDPCAHELFLLGTDRAVLFLRYHHIALDGFGQYLYLRRLAELYEAFENGRTPPVTAAVPLARLAADEAAYRRSPQHAEDAAYWRAQYARPLPPPRAGDQGAPPGPAVSDTVVLDAHRLSDLLGEGPAPFGREAATLIAATALWRYDRHGRTDLVVNLPVTGRRSRAELDTPAQLANELPLRLTVDPAAGFTDLVRHTATKVREALRHQRHRGALPPRTAGAPTAPQVNVMTFGALPGFGSCRVTCRQWPVGLVADIDLNVYREPSPAGDGDAAPGGLPAPGLRLEFRANSHRYGPDDVSRHRRRFLELLGAAGGRPDLPLARLL
ncbi:condensation domain-containing protein [Streptomyces sp. NPDC093795]|uniref:condensation domain-containing protein n=1 Tax=Streptomyces sp. NPDC093795 TaxID=3366051 RepID=UPI0038058B70